MAVVLGCATSGEAQTERVIKVPDGPRFTFLVPMGYSFEAENKSDGSIRISMENPVWDISMQALLAVERDPNVTKRSWQENRLVSFIAHALQLSQEDDYVFQSLPVSSGSGVYCVFTAQGAQALKPGERASGSHYTGGLRGWPGCVLVFAIISPDKTSPEYQEAIDVFSQHVTRH